VFLKKVGNEKLHDAAFFAREIVDDCLQVRIPKNPVLHATSFLLRFSSDFLVSTKCKAIFAVANFRNSSAQFLKLEGCSNFSKLSDSLVSI